MPDQGDAGRPHHDEPDAIQEAVTKPSAARIYDYLIGGGHYFPVDQEFAEQKLKPLLPRIGDYAIENRWWTSRVVRWAIAEGYRQFVDVGSGLPSVGNVHEIADAAAPEGTKVVYIDNDPIAHAYGELLLSESGDPERHAAVKADLLDHEDLWNQIHATGLIDFDKPILLLIAAVLHFVKDEHDPDQRLAFFRAQLPAGSALALSTVTNESPATAEEAEALRKLVAFYEETANPGQLRNMTEFARFFNDWPLVDPGLVYVAAWRPEGESLFPGNPAACRVIGGVARKPLG